MMRSSATTVTIDDALLPPQLLQRFIPLANHTIPEFLYQLTKMLTKENSDIIEWDNGRINVHDPSRLASDILHKYFRHSNYSSFQRQLNYFGFRKIGNKGKMAACTYVNNSATHDLQSLLFIKRRRSTPKQDRAPDESKNCHKGKRKYEQMDTVPIKETKCARLDEATHPSLPASVALPDTPTSDPRSLEFEGINNITKSKLTKFTAKFRPNVRSTDEFLLLPSSDVTTGETPETFVSAPIAEANTSNPLTPNREQIESISVRPSQASAAANSLLDASNNENSTSFDAAGFCASLNQIIRSQSSIPSEFEMFKCDENKSNVPNSEALKVDFSITDDHPLREGRYIRIRDDGLTTLSMEPTPLSEMEFSW
eukprot:CAMPEP_0172501854 /NCGR_PEP_ID=MMETSP1066-20121228/154399_1 /TAXON_ID=671091 /ORGANISM="Coscinodiscus wailesii, Strain CCMP2513" /LENGTH=368 /DNA_ID=CAMNT_0013276883 /DNA_START=24 /DNA_END=1127 /DNA_ORIENTATION=-